MNVNILLEGPRKFVTIESFENDEKCFLFHTNNFFRFLEYLHFRPDFLVIEKSNLTRMLRLI